MKSIQGLILKKYNRLKRTRSGHIHAERYRELKTLLRQNIDAVYDILFDPSISDETKYGVYTHCGHGGSVTKEYNYFKSILNAQIRPRKDELPEPIQHELDWLLKVHGY